MFDLVVLLAIYSEVEVCLIIGKGLAKAYLCTY